jgi:hypothetical protein
MNMRRDAILGCALVAMTLALSGCEFMDFGKWADWDNHVSPGSLGQTAGREWAYKHPGKTPTKADMHAEVLMEPQAETMFEDEFQRAVQSVADEEFRRRKAQDQMYLRNLYNR